MLPHRARLCTRYDPAQRQLHAVDWNGTPLVFDTPAELLHALADQRVFAATVVQAAALWFAADHGVPWQIPATAPAPLRTLQERSLTEGYSLSALQRCLQALDRGYDQTIQLIVPMLEPTDVVCIGDRDGLLAVLLQRALPEPTAGPHVHTAQGAELPADTTVVLVHTQINRAGCAADERDGALIDAAQRTGVSRYGLAPFGPVDLPGVRPADALHAICTGRGMYRPDRVTRYDDDADHGPDIISLT